MSHAALFGALSFATASLRAEAPGAFADTARSFLVVRDDRELWSRAPETRLQPASLAKLLTALVVFDADRDPERWLTVSASAAGAVPTKLGLRAGEEITAGAAMAAMLISSANDACLVLVESVSKDQDAFAERMNAQARQLDMSDSRFVDPCGFDAQGQYSTVTDMLKLAQAARRVPMIARLVALPAAEITTRAGRKKVFTNTNQLLGRLDGAAGMKTGYTSQAGQCLIAYAKRGDSEVWLVMLGGTQRWWQAHGMIDHAFSLAR